MSLFRELNRRNVFRVAAAYIVTGWLLAQVAELGLDAFEAPAWVLKAFILLLVLGFPVALIFSWVYELTPSGLKREADVDRSQSITGATAHKLDRVIIAAMALVIVLLAGERFLFHGAEQAPAVEQDRTESAEYARPAAETVAPQAASPDKGPNVPEKSVAVLPFADLSQSQDYEWFVDGLTEEVLNALAQTPDLLVSSRTSSFRYKATDLDVTRIAEELGVAHVLEGSVRRSGDRIRVTAQLIRSSDGFHVWSETYDRNMQDIIQIQEDLAREIAMALETSMDPEALAEMSRVGTKSVEAYLEFIRGQSALTTRSRDPVGDRKRSYQHHERARELDPEFARAHYLAARFWQVELGSNNLLPVTAGKKPREMLDEFNVRIDAAIRSAETGVERGLYRATKALVELRIRDALRLMQQYVADRPGDQVARRALIQVAVWAEEKEIGRRQMDEIWKTATVSEESGMAYVSNGYRFVDDPEVADRLVAVVQQFPDSPAVLYQGHRALLWAEKNRAAAEAAHQLLAFSIESSIGPDLARARQACANGGRTTVEDILASLNPDDDRQRGFRWHLLLLLGRPDEATEVLQPLFSGGVPYRVANLLFYPQFDARPFPSLMQVLEREGIDRPPPAEIPFACPPPESDGAASDASLVSPSGRLAGSGGNGKLVVPETAAQPPS